MTGAGRDLDALAAQSDGLSGGDLANIVIGAAAAAVGRSAPDRRVGIEDLRREIGRV